MTDSTATTLDLGRQIEVPTSVSAALFATLRYFSGQATPILLIGADCLQLLKLPSPPLAESNFHHAQAFFVLHDFEPLHLSHIIGDAQTYPLQAAACVSAMSIEGSLLSENNANFATELARVVDGTPHTTHAGSYLNFYSRAVSNESLTLMQVGWQTVLRRNAIAAYVDPVLRRRENFERQLHNSEAKVTHYPIARWTVHYTPAQQVAWMKGQISGAQFEAKDISKCAHDYERWLKTQFSDLTLAIELELEYVMQHWVWR